MVQKLRSRLDSPLLIFPPIFEELATEKRFNLPRIMGVIRGSPAKQAGIECGDIITAVNDLPVYSRPQAFRVLQILEKLGSEEVCLKIERGSNKMDVAVGRLYDEEGALSRSLILDEGKTHFYFPYGIVLSSGFQLSWLGRLRETILEKGAKRVLFLSSWLMKPLFEQAMEEERVLQGIDVQFYVRVPKNDFFGGNIFIGDMLVYSDFISAIREFISREGVRPDLVLIPGSTFPDQHWKRDLCGVFFGEIERLTGVGVELIECDSIQF